MGEWLRIAVWSFTSALRSGRDLALENVALRQQRMVIQRQPTENRSVGPEVDPRPVEPRTSFSRVRFSPLLGNPPIE
jgi:hypothetical protein